MSIRVKLVDGRAYQVYEVEAKRVNEQLDSESDFIEFNFEGAKTRIYRQYIVSVEWRGIEND